MASVTSKEHNEALDDILEARRTIREFKRDIPPRTLIEQIIRAGQLAPFAGLAVSGKDYRRFVVVPRDSQVTKQLSEVIKRRVAILSEQFGRQMKQNPFLQQHGRAFARTLEMMSQHGIPDIGRAPYYVIVAERKGIPAVELQSLAHCLQNMWLKATALGLGFRLFSVTAQMAEDRQFCALLSIPYGEFALDGCLIGYASATPPPIERPKVTEATTWVD